jgi:septal ring factor EnvC (AmiA/AmiB activator)
MSDMKNQNRRAWRFDHRVNLSVLIQLAFLASLIVGSWVNLQNQLNLLQHDVTALLQSQKSFEQKLESLQAKSISYEYRIQAIERALTKSDVPEKTF